jgi:hypothetical protein
MAAATLDTIDAALFAQLATLLTTASPGGPLAQVLRYAGTTGADKGVPVAPQGVVPAAMLALEGEDYDVAVGHSGQHPALFVATSTWRVFVVTSELRGHAAAVKGSATTGAYAIATAVAGALAGLVIDGLYRGGGVTLRGLRPVHVKPGQYVYLLRLEAARAIEAVTPADDSVDLEGIDGDVNLKSLADTAPNPLVEFDADTDP